MSLFYSSIAPKITPKNVKNASDLKKKTFLPVARQGFIQAVLMSGRRHRKLNLLIEFKNSIFKKINLKHVIVELAFKINQLASFLLFQAGIKLSNSGSLITNHFLYVLNQKHHFFNFSTNHKQPICSKKLLNS